MTGLGMARNDSPDDNALLAALSSESKRRILPALRCLQLPLGAVLDETYEHIADVFFPIDCIISLVNQTKAGQTTEICVVGREGFIDIAVLDRRRLEQVSCECCQLVKAETEQLYARLPRR